MNPQEEIIELRETIKQMLSAMQIGYDQFMDHLDCADDAGQFWHDAVERGKKSLTIPQPS